MADDPKWPYPTVNMNGTSRKELRRGFVEALTAAQALRMKLESCQPHGRDFQTQSPNLYVDARAAWHAQFNRLVELEDYLLDHAMHVNERK